MVAWVKVYNKVTLNITKLEGKKSIDLLKSYLLSNEKYTIAFELFSNKNFTVSQSATKITNFIQKYLLILYFSN